MKQIETSLRRHLQQSSLCLDAATSGCEALAPLLACIDDRRALEIGEAEIDSSTDRLRVRGRGDFLGAVGAIVSVEFSRGADGVEIRVTATPPTSWQLIQSFPDLPGYLNFSFEHRDRYRPSFFYELDLENPYFVLSSHALGDERSGAKLAAGLSLVGSHGATGPLSFLKPFVADQRFTLAGAVELQGENPELRLSAYLPGEGLSIGPLSLRKMGLTLRSPIAETDTSSAHAGISLHGELRAGDEFSLDVSCAIAVGLSDWLRIEAKSDDLALGSGFAQVAGLVGGGDFLDQLPLPVRDAANVHLRQLMIDVHPLEARVSWVSVDMGSAGHWPIWPDVIDLNEAALRLEVSDPFDAEARSTSLSLFARTQLAGAEMEASVALPAAQVHGRLVEGERFPLGRLLNKFLPWSPLPANLEISDLVFAMDPSRPSLILRTVVDGEWTLPIQGMQVTLAGMGVDLALSGTATANAKVFGFGKLGNIELDLSAALSSVEGLEFEGNLPPISLTDVAKSLLSDLHIALPEVDLEATAVTLSSAGDFTLDTGLAVDLKAFADALSIPIPDGFTHFSLDRLHLEVNAADKTLSLLISMSQPFAFPASGSNRIEVSGLELRVNRSADGETDISCSFTLDGRLSPAPDASLAFDKLHCAWSSAGGAWDIGGTVSGALFGRSLAFSPSFGGGAGARSFSLRTTGPIDIPILEPISKLTLSHLVFELESSGDGEERSSSWNVSGRGALSLEPVFADVAATLALQAGTKSKMFRLQTEAIPARTLPIAGGLEARIAIDPMSVEYTAVEDGSGSWIGKAGAEFALLNVPVPLERFLPVDTLDAEFGFAPEESYLKVESLGPTLPLPALKIGFSDGHSLDLGQQDLAFGELTLRFGKVLRLTETMTLSGLGDVNRIFGYDAKGKPTRRVLKEGFAAELGITSKGAVTFRPLDSPFEAIPLREEDDGSLWSDWNFGSFGQYSFQVPTFDYQAKTSSWQASGGFAREGELRLPLVPIKLLLREAGVPDAVLASIPDAIPIEDVSAEGGEIVPQLRRLIGGQLSGDLATAFDALAEAIDSAMKRMPSRLFDYLGGRVPDRFQFEIAVLPAGGFRAALRCGRPDEENPDPLVLLLPMMMPLPELVGFSLRGFSFGLAGGGSLGMLEIDGHIDRFGLADLVAAASLPDEVLSQETAQALTNRIILEDVFAVVPTAAPVPIPLFYKELGLDLKHIVGLEVQAHWKFPKPELGLAEIAGFVGQYKQFFTDKSYLLHQQPEPGDFSLALTIGENYIKLPDYLGGAALGLRNELPEINIYGTFARLLDGLKTGNAGYLIQAIPLRHGDQWIRIGHEEIGFGPLYLGAAWCITTEKEFSGEILNNQEARQLLGDADADEVLESLPADARAQALDNGFIVLLTAEAGIRGVLGGRASFGIALTSEGGFETGFRLGVSVAELLTLRIGGRLQVKDGVEIEGRVGLYLGDSVLVELETLVSVGPSAFEFQIGFKLTPYFQMKGGVRITAEDITIAGMVGWAYAEGQEPEGLAARATLGVNGMSIAFDANLFGSRCQVVAGVGGESVKPRASLIFELPSALQNSLVDNLSTLGEDIGGEIDRLSTEVDAVSSEAKDLTFKLEDAKNFAATKIEEVAKQLPGIVQRKVVKYIDKWIEDTFGWPQVIAAREGAKPVKRLVRPEVQKGLRPHIKYMRDAAKRLRQADPKDSRDVILKILRETLKRYEHYTYRYRKNIWPIKINYPYTYHMPKELVGRIKEAINFVSRLDEGETIMVTKQQAQTAAAHKKHLIGVIAEGVQSDIEESVPRVKHIRLETELGMLSSRQEVAVGLIYQNKLHEFEIEAELGNLAACMRSAAEKLLAELAGS